MSSREDKVKGKLLGPLEQTVAELSVGLDAIHESRKENLLALAKVIEVSLREGSQVNLNFICTHNSRRSHMAQLWAQAAAHYYAIRGIKCFSGGTEATAFNPRAVEAMRNIGFDIQQTTDGTNPEYAVRNSDEGPASTVFSKKYDHPSNPHKNFVAIMTCSHADHNCPLVHGASERIAITYDDPKDFDGTPQEQSKYRERALEIGREMLYTFSRVTVPVEGMN